jgi:membrane peptidoglycan carboxypeptidase
MVKKAGGFNLTKALKKIGMLLFRLFVIGFQLAMLLIILYRVIPVPLTPLHVKRVFEQVANDKPIKLTKSWRSIDYVTDKFCYAVLTSEDIKFISHYGFDFEQIGKNRYENRKKNAWSKHHYPTNSQKLIFYTNPQLDKKITRNGYYSLFGIIMDQKAHFGGVH